MDALTLGSTLRAAAASHGVRPAYSWDGGQVSFSQLCEQSGRLACGLLQLGLRRGDRVGIIALNQVEWLQAWFAATRIGLVVIGLSVRYRLNELDFFASDSGMKAVVSLPRTADTDYVAVLSDVARAAPALAHRIFIGGGGEGVSLEALAATPLDAAALEAAESAVRPQDLAMVIYTSGTTGRPKGAGLSHRSLLGAATAQLRHMPLRGSDVFPAVLPFNHVGGITCSILCGLLAGATCELLPVFRPDLYIDMARRCGPTVIGGVPTMLKLLLGHPRVGELQGERVRALFVGGSAVDHELFTAAQARFPRAEIYNLYGMSEASGATVMTPASCSVEDRLRFLGKPIPGVSVRVVTAAGQLAAPGEVGELRFRGPGTMEGYVSGAAPDAAFDAEGWLCSGDLGALDARGFIELKGRLKEMYIQGGFNVYPVEVENLIASHPHVLLVAGIGVPDPVLGEVGRYYVVPRPGSAVTPADIVSLCAQHLADYKVPRQVVLRDSLPFTPVGKIHKAALKEEYAAEQART